ncbi:glycosyltransferase [Thiorhodococcus mannitoliphagus]|uniref:Glycosyltransferase n=1 Tax=Thiorhodococcus mannitoliphagus TaxID=329406 RepID=A0A6P1DU62_9GAMM|nr:glycosyltransferase [Thiorhodococcus mannitoliphagus]NEX19234.1 glycosyltransferase [Thiorhodococcus mannitoliphagus]
MRLLIFHLASVFGGAERTTQNLLRHLDRDVVNHVTVAAPAALRDLLASPMDSFVDTGPSIKRGWYSTPSDLLEDVRASARLIDQSQPDLILGMMHYSAALAVLGARAASVSTKTVASYRGPVFEHMRRYESGLRRNVFLRFAVGGTARLANRVVVPSEGTARELSRRFFGSRRRTVVIANGIDSDAVRTAARELAPELERLPRGLPRLCVAARLAPEKDLWVLLRAFKLLQERQPAALIVVGEGPDRDAMESQVEEWGLAGRVVFVGHRYNVYPYIGRAQLYVHTCQFEGFGYTMLEAMACGTPVIATDCPYGPREVIGQNHFGVLTPPGDVSALADAIATLLADPAKLQRLSMLGRDRAEQLSISRMVRSYESVFTSLHPGHA